MHKHFQNTISNMSIILLMAISIIVFPGLGCGDPPAIEDEMETVVPGHLWTQQLDEEHIEAIENLWRTEISPKELIDTAWPGIIQEFPEEVANRWEEEQMQWPIETFEEWKQGQFMLLATGKRSPDTGKTMLYELYIGFQSEEKGSYLRNRKNNIIEDGCYRISLLV